MLLLLLACSDTPTVPPHSRARLYFDEGDPWTSRGKGKTFEVAFSLPEGDYGGSFLVLEELNWSADVTLNGVSHPTVEGGPGWTRLAVEPVAGPNTLTVAVTGPTATEPTPVERGSRSLEARVARNPWLDLAPSEGITALSATLDDGVVKARVQAAGARVRLVAARDGKIIQVLGSAPLTEGTAEISARWKGPTWTPSDPGTPGLLHLWAVVEDDSGTVIDALGERTGFRTVELVDGGFKVGETRTPLVGIRATTGTGPATANRDVLSADLNTVEWHGAFFGSHEAAHLDELGLALVALPRCDGTIGARPEQLAAARSTLVRQDAALARSLAWNPSHVLWAAEGGRETAGPYVAGLTGTDVLVAPADLEVAAIPPRPQAPQASWWSVETRAHAIEGTAAEIRAVRAELAEQMVGGVVLAPTGRREDWAEAWAHVTEIQPPSTLRRAHTRVEEELQPGEILWVEGPWLPRVGQLSQGGTTTTEIWFEGTLSVNGQATAVAAGTWKGGELRR
ncbi:MAG TPA: hypothetical protein QGF58_20730 [Myxococcota bacterium]|nr:hypothetical protein [Myxococcota bacterium]